MRKKLIKLPFLLQIVITILSIILPGCQSSATGGGSSPIFLQIVSGPKKDEILATDKATFTWAGNDKGYSFKYVLYYIKPSGSSEVIDSSAWGSTSKIAFSSLDDGNYRFEVQGKFNNIESKVTRNFSVNAVSGPAVKFFKIKNIVNITDTVKVAVWVEDVANFMVGDFTISFEKQYLTLDSISVSDLSDFNTKNYNTILLPSWSQIKSKANSSGSVSLSFAAMSNTQDVNEGLTGSGGIFYLHFIAKASGTTTVKCQASSKLLNKDKSVITLKNLKEGTIQIK